MSSNAVQGQLQPPRKLATAHFKKAGEVMSQVLSTRLKDVSYLPEHSPTLTKEIADELKTKIKQIITSDPKNRYKLMVNVVVGEKRGQEARMGTRCLWDKNVDMMISRKYENQSLFCSATAYLVYLY